MTWFSAVVLPESPVMSFCFKPCLKKKLRVIGLPSPLARLSIQSMEMNSGVRRLIALAVRQSARRSEAVYPRLIISSPFISVRDPSLCKQAEAKVEPRSFGPRLIQSWTHFLTWISKIDYFGLGDFECAATRAPSQRCSCHRRRCLQTPPPRLGIPSFAALPSQTHRLARRAPGRTSSLA